MLGCCYHYLRAPPLPELTWASDGRRRRGRGGTGRVLKTLDVPKAWPPCPCPLSLQSTTHCQSETEGNRDLLKVTEWLLVKKKKKKRPRNSGGNGEPGCSCVSANPPPQLPPVLRLFIGWRASSPPRGLARPKEVHSRCSVSKIDGTHLFPFVPGDSPTQLVMTGSEGGTPPQALRKMVATKVTSPLTC